MDINLSETIFYVYVINDILSREILLYSMNDRRVEWWEMGRD